MDINNSWIEDFWSDGNWGARQAVRDTEYEKKLAAQRKAESEHKLNEYYRQKAKEMREEFFAKFGDEQYHGGPCCSSCMHDDPWLEFGCCCNTGDYALENKDYRPQYPPVDGELPKEFEFFGDRTRERYVKRFQKELEDKYYIDTYSLVEKPFRLITRKYTHESFKWSING